MPSELAAIATAAIVAVAFSALGFIDDLLGLRASLRLRVQAIIGVVAAIVSVAVTGSSAWFIPLGALLLVGYVNAVNFMDGINGISSLHGAIVGAAFAVTGMLAGPAWLTYMGLTIGAAFIAFLPWNLRRDGFFLGDVGSYLLGGAIAITAVLAYGEGLPALLLLAPLSIYLADTGATLLRRFVHGESITSPHRTHAYQRLTDTGMPHLWSAGLVTTFTAGNAVAALGAYALNLPLWTAWIAVVALCVIYLCVPRLRGSRLATPGYDLPAAETGRPLRVDNDYHPQKWAVIGASGFVGSAVVSELQQRDLDVRAVTAPRLSLSPGCVDPASVLALATDDRVTDELSRQLEGADVVVNAAGAASPDSAADSSLYGANALLPAVIAIAAERAQVSRVIHLSSAAVQGRRPRLDDSVDVAPFSAYSHSKALGERIILAHGATATRNRLVILRATSVQGPHRPTTLRLIRLARSRAASVAAPGTNPSVVSSIDQLAATVVDLGLTHSEVPAIALQPWEGLTVRRVLEAAGGRPRVLPAWMCRGVLVLAFGAGRVTPRFAGTARRLEIMWFGQDQEPGWNQSQREGESAELLRILGREAV
ncbi:NAD-dependent epimerase/dehydratase family protein [Brachybacterium huguangmaarense]|uniref:NAD-dependent epimerase/dehydratase family protein n=1 Tax=Brachybacterium huguangmaarense TaxID=1652028 RepID=A0ABY6G239_9MICO|nr:NAD-dependent epimerase/dehydratase family protein [Brachybacterium huguangmaarense]UYG17272.1 NAD-dependent epimerase/dehydratase family protein [Brachybacterium huguangmaarense]